VLEHDKTLCEAVWNFQNFSATQILREINFGPNTDILTIFLAALKFEVFGILDIFKCQIAKNQNYKPPNMLKRQFLTI